MISTIWASIKSAISWVNGWFTGATGEKNFRAIKKKIRLSKKELHDVQIASARFRGEVKFLKGKREYKIRETITKYYQLQINLIDRIDKEIIELHQGCYDNLKTIKDGLKNKVPKQNSEQQQLLSTTNTLYSRLAETKDVRSELKNSRRELVHRIKVIMDPEYPYYRNHHKLGGLKEIKNILDEQKLFLIKEHSGPQRGIEVAEFLYNYNKLCKSCRSYVFEKMNFCFVCGEELNPERQLIKFLKTKEISCSYCNCPSSEQWEYCPNCGSEFDFAGLKEWIKKIRPCILKK